MPSTRPGPGRPTLWTQEIEDEILDRLESGETAEAICSTDYAGNPRTRGEWPRRSTVTGWAAEDEAFSALYLRAQEDGAAARAERMVSRVLELGDKDPALGSLFLKAESWYLGVVVPRRYGKVLNLRASVAVGGIDDAVRAASQKAGLPEPPGGLADLLPEP